MVQKLMKANIPPTDIMHTSGYKRVESILHYGRLQESQQAAITHILTTPSYTSNSTLNYAQYNSMFHHTSIHHGPQPYLPSAGKFLNITFTILRSIYILINVVLLYKILIII